MRFELFTCDTKPSSEIGPTLPPSSYIAPGQLKNGIPLEFALTDSQDSSVARSYWAFFHFKFLSISEKLREAYLHVSKVEIEWRVVRLKTDPDVPAETEVTVNVRTNVARENSEEKGTYQIDSQRWSKFQINHHSCNFVDVLILVDRKYQIRIQQVKFFTAQQNSPLVYQFNGAEQEGPHLVELELAKTSSTLQLVVAPVAKGSSFSSIYVRGRINWIDRDRTKFDATFASGTKIANRQFDETVTFQRLHTPARDADTLWRARYDNNQENAIAFFFPSSLSDFKISAIVARDTEVPIAPEVQTTSTAPTTACENLNCLPVPNQTAAGIVVGIIGALVVVSLVAAILIWRRKREGGERYTPGTPVDALYPDRNTMIAHMNQQRAMSRNGVSLPVCK